MPRFQRISFKKPFGFQSSFSSDYVRQTQCEKSIPAGNPRSRGGAYRFQKGWTARNPNAIAPTTTYAS